MNKEKQKAYRECWRKEHREQIYEQGRKWRQEHKEQCRIYSQHYYQKHKEYALEYCRKYREEHKESLRIKNKRWRKTLKIEVLTYYSTGEEPICARCGITDIDVLTIDHIEGGGGRHRKALGGYGGVIYHWLRVNSYPKGYQVLCSNCNLKKRIVEGR